MSDNSQVPVTVLILEKEYRIACPENQIEHLRQAAQILDKKMRQMRNSAMQKMSLEKLAIITALNLTYEFLTNQDKLKQDIDNSYKIIDILQEKLEQMLGQSPKDTLEKKSS